MAIQHQGPALKVWQPGRQTDAGMLQAKGCAQWKGVGWKEGLLRLRQHPLHSGLEWYIGSGTEEPGCWVMPKALFRGIE